MNKEVRQMNVGTSTTIGSNNIQANEVQQRNKVESQKKPQEPTQGVRKVTDKVTISAQGNAAQKTSAPVKGPEANLRAEAAKEHQPPAARMLGTNLVA
jgi:hypothetical protein